MNLGMIGFVDDRNVQTNDFRHTKSPMTCPQLLDDTHDNALARQNAQVWSDLLTGSQQRGFGTLKSVMPFIGSEVSGTW